MSLIRIIIVAAIITASGCQSTSRHTVTRLTVEATPTLDGRMDATARLSYQVESYSR